LLVPKTDIYLCHKTKKAMNQLNPIATYFSPDEKTELFEAEYGNMELVIRSRKAVTKVTFRNVGQDNKDSAIQFYIKESPVGTTRGRTKTASFSVPLPLAQLFIDHISKPRKRSL
jgi:hypothetical protein